MIFKAKKHYCVSEGGRLVMFELIILTIAVWFVMLIIELLFT